MQVKYDEGAYLLTRGSEHAAGLDICAPHRLDLHSGEQQCVHTGVHIAIPKFHFGMLVLRSSMAKRGLLLNNTIGIIDSDYRGEIIVDIRNMSIAALVIAKGDRFAQLIICPYLHVKPEVVESLDTTARGEGAFGSTGT